MKLEPNRDSFANVREQVGYCDIWCGGCAVGDGTLRELTRRYEDVIRSHGLPEWGPREVDWEGLGRSFASIRSTAECPGCLKGGGRQDCEMKTCAQSRRLVACTHCSDSSACPHADLLRHMREGALNARIPIETAPDDRELFIGKWSRRIRSGWPGCALFARDLKPDEEIERA